MQMLKSTFFYYQNNILLLEIITTLISSVLKENSTLNYTTAYKDVHYSQLRWAFQNIWSQSFLSNLKGYDFIIM